MFFEGIVNYIENTTTVIVDGTFWCVPPAFNQLLTFNCKFFGMNFPLVFILI
jgi:hypothetical protein